MESGLDDMLYRWRQSKDFCENRAAKRCQPIINLLRLATNCSEQHGNSMAGSFSVLADCSSRGS
jgi:hypothetical protein